MVGVVEGLEVVVVFLGHDFVLEELFGAIELEVGAGGFDLRFLEIGAGLRGVAALEHSKLLPLDYFLTGKDLQGDDASADGREDVHHRGGIGHDVRGQKELVGDRLAVGFGCLDYALRRRGLGLRGLLVFTRSQKEKRGCDSGGKCAPVHGRISVAAAKLS